MQLLLQLLFILGDPCRCSLRGKDLTQQGSESLLATKRWVMTSCAMSWNFCFVVLLLCCSQSYISESSLQVYYHKCWMIVIYSNRIYASRFYHTGHLKGVMVRISLVIGWDYPRISPTLESWWVSGGHRRTKRDGKE